MPAAPLTDEEIPAYWKGLGLPGLADIHVHFLPESMLRKVWAYFDDAEATYGMAWADPLQVRRADPPRAAALVRSARNTVAVLPAQARHGRPG